MTAWIMVDSKGIPFTRCMYDLYDGFDELGEEIKFYTAVDVFAEAIPFTENDMVIGHIDHCIRHIQKITGNKPKLLDYPKALQEYMHRDMREMELYEVANLMMKENPKPIFVKSKKQKHITGFVCSNMSDYNYNCTGREKDSKVYVTDVLDIKSEYRTYVHWHNIVDAIRYKGDYDKAPSRDVLEEMLEKLKGHGMPCAYSIDVGIMANGETVLVECNDCFALGNYGLSPKRYAEMHRDRWYQMIEELSDD